jgi:hypothetical protein
MPDLSAKRTLVKSPPELWEELSEVERLAKHLGAFGEIRITKLEPGQTVAWEGEHASGTVSIEPSGWGTKVTLTAELAEGVSPEPEVPADAAPEEPEVQAPEVPEVVEEPEVPDLPEPPEARTPEEPDLLAPPAAGEPAEEQPARRRRGFWAWLFRPRRAEQHAAEEPRQAPAAEPEVEEPVALAPPVEPEPEDAVSDVAPVEEPVAEAPPVKEPVSQAPVAEEPELEESVSPDREPAGALDPEAAQAVLHDTLDALGSAHHRPFSRG